VSGDGKRVTAHSLGLNGASRTFDEHIAAGRFVLVAHGADRGQATMTRIQETFDGSIAIVQSSRPASETTWQIVRPDGHSAGTFAPEEADDMFDLLRKQLLPSQHAAEHRPIKVAKRDS
jgi:hypothetical protein